MARLLSLMFALIVLSVSAEADIYKHVTGDGVIVYSDVPTGDDSSVYIKTGAPAASTAKKKEEGFYNRVRRYYPIVKETAKEYSIDPDLIKAIITVESNWSPKAVSSKGAMGLMQLMPFTAKSLAVGNPYDPEQNIKGGVKYFRMMLDLFSGNLKKALAAYNAGPTRVKKSMDFPRGHETRSYIRKVLSLYGGEERFQYKPLMRDLYVKEIYKLVLEDGTLLFTDTPLYSGSESF